MEEEEELVTKLRNKFPDITFEEKEVGSDAISINGNLIKGDDYNEEKIMDVIYEELNKTETKDTEETVEATGAMEQFNPPPPKKK